MGVSPAARSAPGRSTGAAPPVGSYLCTRAPLGAISGCAVTSDANDSFLPGRKPPIDLTAVVWIGVDEYKELGLLHTALLTPFCNLAPKDYAMRRTSLFAASAVVAALLLMGAAPMANARRVPLANGRALRGEALVGSSC